MAGRVRAGCGHRQLRALFRPVSLPSVTDASRALKYQVKDSLTSHVDQAEEDAVSPLVSLRYASSPTPVRLYAHAPNLHSLGHASVFLVGGTDRDVPPLAIVLRSGDALLMSGEGRRVFHGAHPSVPLRLFAFLTFGLQGYLVY